MTNGGIEANGPVRSVATSATSGSLVLFVTTNASPETAPAQIFCAVVCASFDVFGTLLTVALTAKQRRIRSTSGERYPHHLPLSPLAKQTSVIHSIPILRFTGITTNGSSARRFTALIL